METRRSTQSTVTLVMKKSELGLVGGELPTKGSSCSGEGDMLDSEEGSRPFWEFLHQSLVDDNQWNQFIPRLPMS